MKDFNDLLLSGQQISAVRTEHIDKYCALEILKQCGDDKELQYNKIGKYIRTVKNELIKADICVMLSREWQQDISDVKKQFSVPLDTKDEKLKLFNDVYSCFDAIEKSLNEEKSGLGWAKMDASLDGTRRKEIIILSGYSSAGKSTYAKKINIHRVLREGNRVLVFSGEEPKEQWMIGLICEIIGINQYHLVDLLKTKEGKDIYTKVAEKLKKYVYVVDKSGFAMKDVWEFTSLANNDVFDKPVDFVIYDHFHLIPGVDGDMGVLSDNANMMKDYVKEFNLTLLMLAQFNEESQKSMKFGKWREPTFSDIKGGNALKAITDTAVLIWRPYYSRLDLSDTEREDQKYITKVKIAKNRRGIKHGIYYDLTFDPRTTHMTEV